MKLTGEQKDLYIKGEATRCPNCGDDNLFMVSVLQCKGTVINIEVGCSHCGEHWREVYELKTVEDIEEDEGCLEFERDTGYN